MSTTQNRRPTVAEAQEQRDRINAALAAGRENAQQQAQQSRAPQYS